MTHNFLRTIDFTKIDLLKIKTPKINEIETTKKIEGKVFGIFSDLANIHNSNNTKLAFRNFHVV